MKPAILLLTLLASSGAFAQHRHVHGEGRLDAVIDQGTVTLTLAMPLDAAVGFERPPKNDKEKAALAAAVKALDDAGIYLPTPAANCTLQSKRVQVPFTGGDDGHAHHAHEGETHHVDIEATHVYACANPAALRGVETTLFKSFRRLYRIEAQRVGPAGQGAQRLSPKNPLLSW